MTSRALLTMLLQDLRVEGSGNSHYIILVLVLTHINYHVLLVLRYKHFLPINYKIVTKFSRKWQCNCSQFANTEQCSVYVPALSR